MNSVGSATGADAICTHPRTAQAKRYSDLAAHLKVGGGDGEWSAAGSSDARPRMAVAQAASSKRRVE